MTGSWSPCPDFTSCLSLYITVILAYIIWILGIRVDYFYVIWALRVGQPTVTL
jgi:hypothetical protein